MTKEGSTQIVNFLTPGARVLVLGHGHIVKMNYFVKIFFSTLQCIDQTNQVCSNNDQGKAYPNCKFLDLRGRVFCARARKGVAKL